MLGDFVQTQQALAAGPSSTSGPAALFQKGFEQMDRSENINELAAALAKAQGLIRNAEKSAKNPHLKSDYANLADIWSACRAALSENALSVVQSFVSAEPGLIGMETLLMHASGQWVGSTLYIPAAQSTAQGIGSAITYARRYSLAALVGVAPADSDDDDGQQASAPSKNGTQVQQVQRVQPEMDAQEYEKAHLHETIRLNDFIRDNNLPTKREFAIWLINQFRKNNPIESRKDLTPDAFRVVNNVIEELSPSKLARALARWQSQQAQADILKEAQEERPDDDPFADGQLMNVPADETQTLAQAAGN